jgi:hypothetical protein
MIHIRSSFPILDAVSLILLDADEVETVHAQPAPRFGLSPCQRCHSFRQGRRDPADVIAETR